MKAVSHRRTPSRCIVVPTDFSPPSKLALEYSIELSRRLDAKLVVVFVVDTGGLALPGTDASGASTAPRWLTDFQRTGRAELEKLSTQLRRRRCRVETKLCVGVTSQEIVRLAKTTNAELIVMGTHGRTGLSRLLLGSVAEKVVRLAPCPVLTVPRAASRRRHR